MSLLSKGVLDGRLSERGYSSGVDMIAREWFTLIIYRALIVLEDIDASTIKVFYR